MTYKETPGLSDETPLSVSSFAHSDLTVGGRLKAKLKETKKELFHEEAPCVQDMVDEEEDIKKEEKVMDPDELRLRNAMDEKAKARKLAKEKEKRTEVIMKER